MENRRERNKRNGVLSLFLFPKRWPLGCWRPFFGKVQHPISIIIAHASKSKKQEHKKLATSQSQSRSKERCRAAEETAAAAPAASAATDAADARCTLKWRPLPPRPPSSSLQPTRRAPVDWRWRRRTAAATAPPASAAPAAAAPAATATRSKLLAARYLINYYSM